MSPTTSAPVPGTLTAAQQDQFHREGYLVLPGFFDPAKPLARARELVNTFDASSHPLTRFTTEASTSAAHIGDEYFLSSGDQVRHFLEEEAVDTQTGKLTTSPDRAVNKIGHGLHIHDEVFREFSFSSRLQDLARSLGMHTDPRVLQSMIICKQPSIGGAVPHHNDSTFLYTDPPSAIGFWFALEDCTRDNGCLSFLKGSHRWSRAATTPSPSHSRPLEASPEHSSTYGPPRGINKRFVRNRTGAGGTTFEQLDTDEEAHWSEEDATLEECPAGTLVLIHGSVLHQSKKNTSDKSRYIYTFHMIEGDHKRAKYDDKNWLQTKGEFSRLYAGAAGA